MAKYFLTKKALADLSEIWEYTFENWSESQADKYYLELISSCQYLTLNYNLGKKYDQISNEILGYKSGQHIIFYRILSFEAIEITRILHSSMDLRSRIND
jgi:toxin ParE1/3/4